MFILSNDVMINMDKVLLMEVDCIHDLYGFCYGLYVKEPLCINRKVIAKAGSREELLSVMKYILNKMNIGENTYVMPKFEIEYRDVTITRMGDPEKVITYNYSSGSVDDFVKQFSVTGSYINNFQILFPDNGTCQGFILTFQHKENAENALIKIIEDIRYGKSEIYV